MVSASNRASLAARDDAAGAGRNEPPRWRPHIEHMTIVVEGWRAGAQLKTFLASYESVLARLLYRGRRAGGRAGNAWNLALQVTHDTGVHFYEAELLRGSSVSYLRRPGSERHTGLREAIELAQTQGALVFELRAAADDFELVGEPARVALVDALESRFPADQSWPELARARALLG